MPVTVPDFTVGAFTLRDSRNAIQADRERAGALLFNDLFGFYPPEVACRIPPWERYARRAALEQGILADYEARKGVRLSTTAFLGEHEPIVLVGYNAQGAVAGAFALVGVRMLGLVNGVRQVSVRPFPASTQVSVANKAALAFDVAEALFAVTAIGDGGQQFRVQELATWFYRDAVRNSIGDQFMAAYQTQLTTRTTRLTRPLSLTSTANDGLTGRRLDVIRAS